MAKLMKKARRQLFVAVLALVVSVTLIGALLTYFQVTPQVVVVPITGDISLYGEGASSQKIVKEIKTLDEDITVKAIILEVNSPGGTVVASEEISTAVEDCEKPVVAWLRETAASGAYWISASSDHIVADPATMTAGIGVTSSYLQFSDLMETYGVEYERVVSGQYKDIGSPYKDLTPSERAVLQEKVDKISELFINHITETRNLSGDAVKQLSSGEVLLGTEAKELGLVDELGSKEEAFEAAKKLANVKDARLVEPDGAVESFFDEFFSSHMYWIGRGVGDSFKLAAKGEQGLLA